MAKRKKSTRKSVETLTHDEAKRTNIPTAEHRSVMAEDERRPVRVAYERRNRDLDPQLVWRGKDEQDWSDLVVHGPPLYIQEKVHPKVLVDDLRRRSEADNVARRLASGEAATPEEQFDLFADFNGLPDPSARTEFYQHDANWTNRMILGDSLQVMASLAEREGLRGKVQCIYLDPPYGIKFNSNFQWSTTSRDVKDGKQEHITREPEQVKAFRDTWRDGIHSYLTYLRDRFTAARDLLADTGSIFVQIGDENVHRVRAIMDEVFGDENFISLITYPTSVGLGSQYLDNVTNYVIWYAKSKDEAGAKSRNLFRQTTRRESGATRYTKVIDEGLIEYQESSLSSTELNEIVSNGGRFFTDQGLTSRTGSDTTRFAVFHEGRNYRPTAGGWRTSPTGMRRVQAANRILKTSSKLRFRKFFDDFSAIALTNSWYDVSGGIQSRNDPKVYVVQTATSIVERCILMATDPDDLVLDPTCGSGTTATVAEQWGRRWITIDTSRVALALARARIMGAKYPYYLLADSPEGRAKEAEVARRDIDGRDARPTATRGDIRQGFVYERVPHITLKSIANNSEIDAIWERTQPDVEQALAELNAALRHDPPQTPFKVATGGRAGRTIDFTAAPGGGATTKLPSGEQAPAHELLEWEAPRELPHDWPDAAAQALERFWEARIARQKEIDASIAAKADFEYLYDKPYEDRKKVRVAGPFTVESISPHRTLGMDENDELIEPRSPQQNGGGAGDDGEGDGFARMVLEHLKTAGVQQAERADRIEFTSITPWPGGLVGAEGRYEEGAGLADDAKRPASDAEVAQKRAAIFIGPEFGTVGRPDLVAAAREAGDAGFDVLIACGFNFEAHASDFKKLGRIPILKARMNADLHMAGDLKNTGRGNLFVIFGEPDIEVLPPEDAERAGGGEDIADYDRVRVRINGVDVFKPQTGRVESSDPDDIACWFIDTDYNEESFFVRQAYFLGARDPYKSLRTTLKAEINEDAWATLHSDTSREFEKPASGRIAVKVINHLGDEVMKVFRVE